MKTNVFGNVLSSAEMKHIKGGNVPQGCTNTCKNDNNDVLGELTPQNCDTALSDCKAKWDKTTVSVCSCPNNP